jgi:FeS assembly SUF system protein
LLPGIVTALKGVFDPEIPVNIYELGLIYKIEIDETNNVAVKMTLTAPGCPVAGEMPDQVRAAVAKVDGLGDVDVELVWEPSWHPGMMAETAKLQLGMF